METTFRVKQILDSMQTGWNNADGASFVKPFAALSQFVDIRGTLHANATIEQLATAHDGLFNSVYKGSKVFYKPVQVTDVNPGYLLLHVDAELEVPAGPMEGKHYSTISMLIETATSPWTIKAFHNTLKVK